MAERAQSVDAERSEPATSHPTTARVDLPTEEFALAGLFERVPEASVELEPAVAMPDDHAILCVGADRGDHGTITAALREDPALAAVETFGERDAGRAYRVQWDGRARRCLRAATAEGITVADAWARDGRWSFRLVAPDRETLSAAYAAVEELGYRPECKHIAAADGQPASRSDLTDQQREALIAAFESGYYHIPRDLTAEDLAEDLDISHQALSERLRRAHEHLVGTTLRLEE